MQGCVFEEVLAAGTWRHTAAFPSVIPLRAEKQRGKDMNQMDEPGLSLAVIDPFASGLIQGSFGDPHPSSSFFLLLFDTSLKAFKRLSCTQFGTLGAELMG